MPQAIPIEIRRMISRFGAAAVADGLLTPAIAFPETDRRMASAAESSTPRSPPGPIRGTKTGHQFHFQK